MQRIQYEIEKHNYYDTYFIRVSVEFYVVQRAAVCGEKHFECCSLQK